ncbi:MAG: ABC transporter ATP-binding protein [Bacteroidia bacterium]|nr:ABC transporter ATP-binding protein [Bacteroidia bacterium]MDW8088169.1 ABC transporter ATP-binding protein [Bacteroidia bacterium]
MSHLAIRAVGLGKAYRRSGEVRYNTLRDRLSHYFWRPWDLFRQTRSVLFWALREVSFEVKQGEVLGIIGRNGAGKTTLLKLLSRLTEPTEGYAEIYGRVSSLLEVGTGFHEDLTGRENIYFNGILLGMKRNEIKRKIDAIIEFAGIKDFIDTPMKKYSPGMRARLAFSIAAHLEPEILLVDEVLAVGDIEFQKKCLGKMEEVSKGSGRTVLFVSHQMNLIKQICHRTMWLEGGRLQAIGPTLEVVDAYEKALLGSLSRPTFQSEFRGKAESFYWYLLNSDKTPHTLCHLDTTEIAFVLDVFEPIYAWHYEVNLFDSAGRLLWSGWIKSLRQVLEPGRYEVIYKLPLLPLSPGIYHWRVILWGECERFVWECRPEFVVDVPNYQHFFDEYAGILNLPYQVKMNLIVSPESTPNLPTQPQNK